MRVDKQKAGQDKPGPHFSEMSKTQCTDRIMLSATDICDVTWINGAEHRVFEYETEDAVYSVSSWKTAHSGHAFEHI
jgi:hypothetical protein